MSYEEYTELESSSETKHEFAAGEVFAMAGGTPEHGRLALTIARLLGNALEGRPCAIFSSDVRVRIAETNRALYPDLSIVCSDLERADDDPQAITNPVVIVEVLSDATEAYDRGDKFAHYRRLRSLREYLLVSQNDRRLELFRREGEHWTLYEAVAGQSLQLAELGVELGVDDVYRDPLARGDQA